MFSGAGRSVVKQGLQVAFEGNQLAIARTPVDAAPGAKDVWATSASPRSMGQDWRTSCGAARPLGPDDNRSRSTISGP